MGRSRYRTGPYGAAVDRSRRRSEELHLGDMARPTALLRKVKRERNNPQPRARAEKCGDGDEGHGKTRQGSGYSGLGPVAVGS